jgi:hypothetical protein
LLDAADAYIWSAQVPVSAEYEDFMARQLAAPLPEVLRVAFLDGIAVDVSE